MVKVGVAIPARNEKRAIGSMVVLCKEHVDSVLVIDDGSTDKTGLIAKLAGAEVITHKTNLGKGGAIITALKWAQNSKIDILVLVDGDGQHDPDAIPDLIRPIFHGEADITIGSRWHHEKGLKEMPFHRIFGNWVLSTATSLSLKKLIKDSQSGYRAFHKRTIPTLMKAMETGFAVESEMLTLADNAGFKWVEIGIFASYGNGLDTSTEGALYHGLSVLGKVLKVLRVHKPVRFFGFLSMVSFLSVVGIAFWGRIMYPEEKLLPLGVLYAIASFMIIGGFFMFSGIMLAGMNRISERILQIVIDIGMKNKKES